MFTYSNTVYQLECLSLVIFSILSTCNHNFDSHCKHNNDSLIFALRTVANTSSGQKTKINQISISAKRIEQLTGWQHELQFLMVGSCMNHRTTVWFQFEFNKIFISCLQIIHVYVDYLIVIKVILICLFGSQ